MKFQLINITDLTPVRKPINGFPATRERDNLDGCNEPEGYKYIIDEPRPTTATDGMRWTRSTPTLDAWGWHKVSIPEPTPEPVSKLTIMRRLQDLGKWQGFKAMLSMLPEESQDAWTLALDIAPDDPLFLAHGDAIKEGLELTDEQFNQILTP